MMILLRRYVTARRIIVLPLNPSQTGLPAPRQSRDAAWQRSLSPHDTLALGHRIRIPRRPGLGTAFGSATEAAAAGSGEQRLHILAFWSQGAGDPADGRHLPFWH